MKTELLTLSRSVLATRYWERREQKLPGFIFWNEPREDFIFFVSAGEQIPSSNFAPQVKTELSGSVQSLTDSIAAFHSQWWLEANLNLKALELDGFCGSRLFTLAASQFIFYRVLELDAAAQAGRQAVGRKVLQCEDGDIWYLRPEPGPPPSSL